MNLNDKFSEGQRVTVTVTGKFTGERTYSNIVARFSILGDDGLTHLYNSDSPSVTVEAANPEYWPPEIGDMWEADGNLYVARQWRGRTGITILDTVYSNLNAIYSDGNYGNSIEDFGKLNPVLLFRKGVKDST